MKNKLFTTALCGAFLYSGMIFNNSFAEEASSKNNKVNYQNKFIIGATAGTISSSSELKEPENTRITNNIDVSGSSASFGVNARYKIYVNKSNLSSFFIAPEVFYNSGSAKGDDNKSYGIFDIEVDPTYGAKLSLGIELDKKHAFSLGAGVQNVDYKYRYSSTTIDAEKNDSELAWLISGNYEYNMTDYFAINFNFDFSSFTFKTPNKNIKLSPLNFMGSDIVADEIETSIARFSVGFAFRF